MRWLPWALLVMAAVQFVQTALPPGRADLISIQSLALDLRRGDKLLLYPGPDFILNPQWVAHHEQNLRQLNVRGEPNWCFYPPLIPFLLAPVATVNPEVWRLTWGIIQIGLLFLYAELILHLLRRAGVKPVRRIWIYVLLIGSYPAARSLELGQTSLLVAVLLYGALLLDDVKRPVLSALLFGISLLFKPFLAVAQMANLARQRLESAIYAGLALVGLLTLSVLMSGLQPHVDYWQLLKTLAHSQTAYYGNQSFIAGLLRFFSDWQVMDYGFGHSQRLVLVCQVLAILIAGVTILIQWRARFGEPLLLIGLWLAAVLLALPISWEHHLLLLLPVLALCWGTESGIFPRFMLGAATALLSIRWTFLYSDVIPGRWLASLPMFGTMLLYSFLAWRLFNTNSTKADLCPD
jgi:hypothetical protein